MAAVPQQETSLKRSKRIQRKLQGSLVPHRLTNKQKAKTRIHANSSSSTQNATMVTKAAHNFRRIETLYREVAQQVKETALLKARASQQGQVYVEGEPKLLLVVRIKGIRKVPHRARKTMQLLGLNCIHSARFLQANKATLAMLSAAESYLAFGYPSLGLVRDLIYKRGYADINRQRISISSNEIISRHLGQFNILCVEDLIKEIFTVGPNFQKCCKFLSIFRLNSPRKGLVSKKRHFVNGGSFGLNEKFITQLVSKML